MAFLDPLVSYSGQGVLAAINFSIERDDALHEAMRGLAGKTIAFRLDIPGVFDGLTCRGSFAKDGLLQDVFAQPGPRTPLTKGSLSDDQDSAEGPMAESSSCSSSAPPADVTLWLTSGFFGHAARQAAASFWPSSEATKSGVAPESRPSGLTSMHGVRIEGDAALAQRLVPLLEVMADRVSPLQLLIARSPVAQIAQKAVNYAVYESGVLITKKDMAAHSQSLRALRERIDRFEKKLALLTPRG